MPILTLQARSTPHLTILTSRFVHTSTCHTVHSGRRHCFLSTKVSTPPYYCRRRAMSRDAEIAREPVHPSRGPCRQDSLRVERCNQTRTALMSLPTMAAGRHVLHQPSSSQRHIVEPLGKSFWANLHREPLPSYISGLCTPKDPL